MSKRRDVWFLLADSRRARLMRGWLTPRKRPHVEEEADLEFEFLTGEHGRPSPRTQKNGHSYAGRSHEEDELMSQFAREVAAFAEAKLDELRLTGLHLFASPKFLGALRKFLSSKSRDRVVEHDQELTNLTEARLAAHSEIVQLIAS